MAHSRSPGNSYGISEGTGRTEAADRRPLAPRARIREGATFRPAPDSAGNVPPLSTEHSAAPRRTFPRESSGHTLGSPGVPAFRPAPSRPRSTSDSRLSGKPGPGPRSPVSQPRPGGGSQVQLPHPGLQGGGSPSKGQRALGGTTHAAPSTQLTVPPRTSGEPRIPPKTSCPSQAGPGAPPVARLRRDTHRVVQLRFLAVRRVPHVASGEDRGSPAQPGVTTPL